MLDNRISFSGSKSHAGPVYGRIHTRDSNAREASVAPRKTVIGHSEPDDPQRSLHLLNVRAKRLLKRLENTDETLDDLSARDSELLLTWLKTAAQDETLLKDFLYGCQ